MPAPTPIDIRYDNVGLLGAAAAASGAGSTNLEARRRREALDAQILMAQIGADSRRAPFVSQFGAGTNPLQTAAGYGGVVGGRSEEGELKFKLENEAKIEQQKADIVARIKAAKKAKTPVELVPDGSVSQDPYGVSTRIRDQQGGESVRYRNGSEAWFASGQDQSVFDEAIRAAGPGEARAGMVTPNVREQLRYLETLKGQLPDEAMASLMQAARSGGLKMPQLIDDARAAMPKAGSTARTTFDRNQDKYSAEAMEMDSVNLMPPQDQAQYARRRFQMQDPDIYTDEDAIAALQSRQRQLKAIVQPVTNSGGKSMSGGNVVKVNTPDEARRLPPGTYFQTPDGRMKRVPL